MHVHLRGVAPFAVVPALCSVLVVTSLTPAAAQAPVPAVHQRYELPVEAGVLRHFEAPVTRFAAGHRGVDLDVPVGGVVRAASGGTVRFVGRVAGIGWVSVDHADGITTTYGPVTGIGVRAGERVGLGQPLARLAPGGHGHDRGDRGLHVGARTAAGYLDPLALLDAPGGRASLVGPGGWSPSPSRRPTAATPSPGMARAPDTIGRRADSAVSSARDQRAVPRPASRAPAHGWTAI